MTIVSAVVGVLLGWPVAGVAFLPYAVFVLLQPRLAASFATAAVAATSTLIPIVLVDLYFYGKLTVSIRRI